MNLFPDWMTLDQVTQLSELFLAGGSAETVWGYQLAKAEQPGLPAQASLVPPRPW